MSMAARIIKQMFVTRRLLASRPPSSRSFATLVLSEHFEGKLNPSFGSVLTAAQQLQDPQIDVLVHGEDTAEQVEALQKYAGLNKIIVAKHATLQNPYGDYMSKLALQIVS